MTRDLLVAAASALCALAGSAWAQCTPQWLPGQQPPGVNGAVSAMTKWDPDGAGPGAPVLVAGGSFEVAGNAVAGHVAAWDGTRWSPLGAGPPTEVIYGFTSGSVTTLGVYNGELLAGVASHTTEYSPLSAGEVLYRWDGASWVGAGTGIKGAPPLYYSPSSLVSAGAGALAVYQGQLIVGGHFATVNGQPAGGLARLAGSWQPMAGGVNGSVYALAVFQGQLYAGGEFTTAGGLPAANIARWDGASWHPVAAGVTAGSDPMVLALTVFDGALAAAGSFQSAGGIAASNVARWNGSAWQALGAGIPQAQGYGVRSLAVYDGELVASGRFSSAQPGQHVRRWNGQVWQDTGIGFEDRYEGDSQVGSLLTFNGELVAAGHFRGAGGNPAWNMARWSGLSGQWRSLGGTPGIIDGMMAGVCEYAGGVAAWGMIHEGTGHIGGVLHRVGMAGPWQTLATFPDSGVSDAIEYGGELVIGGPFMHVGGVPAKRIARWNGLQWRPLHWGMTNTVNALELYNGDLVAGGQFAFAGGQPAKCVARWDGASWHAIGAGLSGTVFTLAAYNGDLIAGGLLPLYQPGNNLYRWDGVSWTVLGGGVDYAPKDLAVFRGELIVAGIGRAGSLFVHGLARWNGSQWGHVGNPIPGTKSALAVYRDELIVAGEIGGPSPGIVRFNGVSWQGMHGGVRNPPETSHPYVSRVMVMGDELIATGGFASAGGKVSYGMARWGCRCYADCNHNGFLGGGDHTCFLNLLNAQHPYTDCDGDGQWTMADYTCFQARFAAGCP